MCYTAAIKTPLADISTDKCISLTRDHKFIFISPALAYCQWGSLRMQDTEIHSNELQWRIFIIMILKKKQNWQNCPIAALSLMPLEHLLAYSVSFSHQGARSVMTPPLVAMSSEKWVYFSDSLSHSPAATNYLLDSVSIFQTALKKEADLLFYHHPVRNSLWRQSLLLNQLLRCWPTYKWLSLHWGLVHTAVVNQSPLRCCVCERGSYAKPTTPDSLTWGECSFENRAEALQWKQT